MPDKRQKMVTFKLNEISAVDAGAQPEAKVTIMKRAAEKGDEKKKKKPGYSKEALANGEVLAKQVALTDVVDGHQHFVITSGVDEYAYGYTSWTSDHDHAWIRLEDGSIQIAEAEGHTHTIAVIGKQEDGNMTDVTKQDKPEASEELTKLQAKYDRLEKINALSADHRAEFDKLKGDAADQWLEKSAGERDETIRKAAEQNAVVYTDGDGTEYRKSDDPRLVMLAKARDEDRKRIEKMEAERADAEVTKIAEELTAYPGDLDTRKAIVKSIHGIEDADEREKAMKALRAQNDNLAKSMKELGVTGAPVEKADGDADPMARINELAEEYLKAHAAEEGMNMLKARAAVYKTPEGRELMAADIANARKREE